ncbi:MAG: Gfo/Idh/MocA family oxidoreductase, partial [Armatimonadetes bacterium]|nr:Gfo/Idh/MocA family oxidoreductase [Armatimonadota bacterium]
GVVGIGNMGQHHARIYDEMSQVKLVGLVDIDKTKGDILSKKYNTNFYTDYKKLFGHVKAVNIVVPTSLHYQIAMDFLKQGIHVLVEKPITLSLNQAKELVSIAKNKNLILQVGHLERFNPAVGVLKNLLKKPLFIETQRHSYPTNYNLDVGVVWDLMIHDLDILSTFINSPIVDIHANGLSLYSNFEDLALVRIFFENGCIANLLASRISGEKLRKLKIIEEKQTMYLDFINQTLSVMHAPKNGRASIIEDIEIEKKEPLQLELEHFTECVATNRTPLVTGEDGKKALELAIQIVDSMQITKDKKIAGELIENMEI